MEGAGRFMNLTLLGAPGSGKGTQGRRLAERLGLAYFSSGDLLRSAISRGTEAGLRAKPYLEAGHLVPDDVLVPLVCTELLAISPAGVVLDGFPRTRDQALALDATEDCAVDAALLLDVPEDVVVERLASRLMCGTCGSSFSAVSHRPKQEGVCDACGGPLKRRGDDAPETVRHRIAVYHESASGLAEYYDQRGVLLKIDGNAPEDQVTEALLAATQRLNRIPIPAPTFQAA
jgi:adenylate kinase